MSPVCSPYKTYALLTNPTGLYARRSTAYGCAANHSLRLYSKPQPTAVQRLQIVNLQAKLPCRQSLTKSSILYAYKSVAFVRGFVRRTTFGKAEQTRKKAKQNNFVVQLSSLFYFCVKKRFCNATICCELTKAQALLFKPCTC